MLNISPGSLHAKTRDKMAEFNSFKRNQLSPANKLLVRWLAFMFLMVIMFFFLPWTQNVQSKGKVTTLRPEQRPQTIHATIAGRIEKWFVQEGQFVKKGDTIVHLSEIKAEYFDPNLVSRTNDQVRAKEGAIVSYDSKVVALDEQIQALSSELIYKQKQLKNKIKQQQLKITSDSIDVIRAETDYQIAQNQLERTQGLFDQGIKSLTELEQKKLKVQDTNAKLIESENKLLTSQNELINAQLELNTVLYETNQKIAKAESDRFSTLSQKYDAEAGVTKLRIESANYERRSDFYYITAPQDCYIMRAIKPGIGETIKEGDPVVSITPAEMELAVELFIKPMDLPLIKLGQEVRFIFDGWPAIVFSGWPGQSFGTFSGEVVAIDNDISSSGEYRILVAPRINQSKPWPDALRPGSGAEGIALLRNVPLWYEVWRQLNGFPPEYYAEDQIEVPKLKAPVKSIK